MINEPRNKYCNRKEHNKVKPGIGKIPPVNPIEIDFVNKALSQVREQKCEYMIKSLSQILAPQE